MKKIILSISHLLTLVIGFIIGIYVLPILIAPPAPSAEKISQMVETAQFSGTFKRDLQDSDAFHWGEGTVFINAETISLKGELAPGPDYKLYLSPRFIERENEFLATKAQMTYVADVKTFDNFIVNVPEGIDINQYNTVIVWCESFNQFISAARYQ